MASPLPLLSDDAERARLLAPDEEAKLFWRMRRQITRSTLQVLFNTARLRMSLVLVLSGVDEPGPGADLSNAEIPTSQPLGPGDSVVSNAQLLPLMVRSHYKRQRTLVATPPEVDVVCRAAYGETPIGPREQEAMSLKDVLAWQHWVDAAPIRLKTPG